MSAGQIVAIAGIIVIGLLGWALLTAIDWYYRDKDDDDA